MAKEADRRNRGRGAKDELGRDVEARARRLAEAATRSTARFLARAREEVEDIWAEARDRRGRR